MPRGNDPTALQRIADEYGANAGNAEKLIEANAARYTRAMREAALLPIDEEATAELDPAKVAKAVGCDAEDIAAFAVRGHYVSVVLDQDGAITKTAVPLDSVEAGEAYTAPIETLEDTERVRHEAQAQADTSVQAALAKAQKVLDDAQAKAAKLIRDATAKAQATADRTHAEAVAELQGTEVSEADAAK